MQAMRVAYKDSPCVSKSAIAGFISLHMPLIKK